MKKLLVICASFLLLTACSNINHLKVDEIINKSINKKNDFTNIVRVGYKYYKPSQMSIIENTDYNEVLRYNGKLYYLYIYVIGYYNNIDYKYQENDLSYYSKAFSTKDKKGYIEINEAKDNQYLIEIVYNYAKIEVMVDKDEINEAVAYSSSILSSIIYNKIVIENTFGQDVINSHEESIDLFTKKKSESATLKYVESDHYDKDVIPDMDLVN